MLVDNGAGELYCGLQPQDWTSTYSGALWMNRRSPAGANLSTYDDLSALVGRAHAHAVPVFLTLNAPVYMERQLPYLVDLARRALDECAGRCADRLRPALLLTLAEMGLGRPRPRQLRRQRAEHRGRALLRRTWASAA